MWLRFHRFIWGVGNLGTHSLTAVHQFGVDSTFHRVFLLLCWAKEKKKNRPVGMCTVLSNFSAQLKRTFTLRKVLMSPKEVSSPMQDCLFCK